MEIIVSVPAVSDVSNSREKPEKNISIAQLYGNMLVHVSLIIYMYSFLHVQKWPKYMHTFERYIQTLV